MLLGKWSFSRSMAWPKSCLLCVIQLEEAVAHAQRHAGCLELLLVEGYAGLAKQGGDDVLVLKKQCYY